MKWFGTKAAQGDARPVLARAWGTGAVALGEWPASYEAQLRAGVMGNPVAQRAMRLVSEGADLIDVGGESTRPGANAISCLEECDRVLPIIEEIKATSEILISIDTYKSDVARQSINAGAEIVNDISGMTRDADMVEAVAETGSIVVITYNRDHIVNDDEVIGDMKQFFDEALEDQIDPTAEVALYGCRRHANYGA